jgi:2,3-bisphosphoglycerate-independent phosphoglycerate mutase
LSTYSLKPLRGYRPFAGPVVCAILDGVGLGKRDESDGVFLAHTPVLDALMQEPVYLPIKAHGRAVGMPSDQDMGNSEVGHNTIGAGRIFAQGAKRVSDAIANGELFNTGSWKKAIDVARGGNTLHFIGLLSDGNVHSHIDHLFAMLDAAAVAGVPRVRLHVLADGRDVDEKSALRYLAATEQKLATLNRNEYCDYRIASGGGRMVVTMDRYNADWRIVERGWKAHVLGQGRGFASAKEAVETYYREDPRMTDQYLDSYVITDSGAPIGTINDGDAVIFFNFRGDRAIELSMAFEQDDFTHFDRQRRPKVFYAGMMEYDGDVHVPKNYLLPHASIPGSLGQYLCGAGVRSYAVSETQKFGHVTYFWNGNNSGYIAPELEEYVEILSDLVPCDQRPWMKAAEITDAVIGAIAGGKHKFIRLNYPNGDMVGHTGVPEAVRIAVEATDLSLGRLLRALERAGGVALILADHGNADLMFTVKDGVRMPHVAHTLNPVPCIVKDYSGANRWTLAGTAKIPVPGLSNIAATLCTLLGYEPPAEYDPSLIALAV